MAGNAAAALICARFKSRVWTSQEKGSYYDQNKFGRTDSILYVFYTFGSIPVVINIRNDKFFTTLSCSYCVERD